MGIQQTTPDGDINAFLMREIDKREKAIIKTFNYIGETCAKNAKEWHTYQDQTGNLTSSIGYVVVRNGNPVNGSVFDMKEDGWEGKAAGERQLQKLIADFPNGIVLIVVAGMNYAAAVEARNLNVLTSAELMAEQLVPSLMKQLGFTR